VARQARAPTNPLDDPNRAHLADGRKQTIRKVALAQTKRDAEQYEREVRKHRERFGPLVAVAVSVAVMVLLVLRRKAKRRKRSMQLVTPATWGPTGAFTDPKLAVAMHLCAAAENSIRG
jgi:hypothetical protein